MTRAGGALIESVADALRLVGGLATLAVAALLILACTPIGFLLLAILVLALVLA